MMRRIRRYIWVRLLVLEVGIGRRVLRYLVLFLVRLLSVSIPSYSLSILLSRYLCCPGGRPAGSPGLPPDLFTSFLAFSPTTPSSPLPQTLQSLASTTKRQRLTISRTGPPSQTTHPTSTKTDPPPTTNLSPTPTPFDLISSPSKTWMGSCLSCCSYCLCGWVGGLAFVGCLGWV